jgi:hypothetical protein
MNAILLKSDGLTLVLLINKPMNKSTIITEIIEFTPEMQQAIAKHMKDKPESKHCRAVISTKPSSESLLKDFDKFTK